MEKRKGLSAGRGIPPGKGRILRTEKEGEDYRTYFPLFLKVWLALEMPLFLTEGPENQRSDLYYYLSPGIGKRKGRKELKSLRFETFLGRNKKGQIPYGIFEARSRLTLTVNGLSPKRT